MKHHLKKLRTIKAAASNAISVFTRTKNELESQNEQLDELIDILDEEMLELTAIRGDAYGAKVENVTVIENIDKILGGK